MMIWEVRLIPAPKLLPRQTTGSLCLRALSLLLSSILHLHLTITTTTLSQLWPFPLAQITILTPHTLPQYWQPRRMKRTLNYLAPWQALRSMQDHAVAKVHEVACYATWPPSFNSFLRVHGDRQIMGETTSWDTTLIARRWISQNGLVSCWPLPLCLSVLWKHSTTHRPAHAADLPHTMLGGSCRCPVHAYRPPRLAT